MSRLCASAFKFLGRELPLDILLVTLHLFAPFEPRCHLRQLVLLVASAVCVLGEVDVKALRVLRVVVVSHAEHLNCAPVVVKRVQLRKPEVFSYA